ncbi:phenylacetate--CoA ligase family protein [Aestuariivirga sp.]|uniref:phenylacetate--CoA ligase family protein n=1 Tax=Aestuariivirga sp. TaxID=2650926 RepID=UPI0039E6B5D7
MTEDQTSGENVRGVTSQQLRELLQESMYWTPRQMWDFQALQLEQLVRHAWTHVPLYTDRLRCLIRPDGSVDLSRWSEVPIVQRKDLQQHRVLMLSPHLPRGHGRAVVGRTSGSSGRPIAVDFSELFSLVSSMAWERASRLHDIPFEKGIAEFQALLPDGQSMTVSTYQLPRGPTNPPKFLLNRKLPTPEKLRALAETKTAVLVDVPNHAEVLARENLRQGRPVSLHTFVAIGMAVSPLQEELISRSFGARVFSPYSSMEGGMLGFQCATQRSNFHINSELVLLEIVDAEDKPVRPGEAGRVIITPLFNAAQPLIRYEQGDIVVRGPPCSCGLTLPVLSKIQRNVDDMLHMP